MQAATQTRELIVWTQPKMLDEAKTVFASFEPKFQTMPFGARKALEEGEVGVLYLSHPDQGHAFEKTIAALRNWKVSSIVFYVPHHSADFAFKIGMIVGRDKFPDTEWAFNFPHLRQLLKARNINAHISHRTPEPTFVLSEARERLGLSQTQMATALNVSPRTLQNWEAGKGTSLLFRKTRDLRELLSLMDDYVVAPKERQWLSSGLDAFRGQTPQELVIAGRMRNLIVEFERLREGQPV